MRLYHFVLVCLVAAVIGCGGGGTNALRSTSGTAGGSTGNNPFMGNFVGALYDSSNINQANGNVTIDTDGNISADWVNSHSIGQISIGGRVTQEGTYQCRVQFSPDPADFVPGTGTATKNGSNVDLTLDYTRSGTAYAWTVHCVPN